MTIQIKDLDEPTLEVINDADLEQVVGGGLIDGALNNLDVIDHVSALNTNINSDVTTSESRNTNTRASGSKNNVSFSVSI